MGGDREECLGVDTLFGEVDVALGCGVNDVDVGALTGAATGVGRDGDQSMGGWAAFHMHFRLGF